MVDCGHQEAQETKIGGLNRLHNRGENASVNCNSQSVFERSALVQPIRALGGCVFLMYKASTQSMARTLLQGISALTMNDNNNRTAIGIHLVRSRQQAYNSIKSASFFGCSTAGAALS